MFIAIEDTSKPNTNEISMDSSIWFVVIKTPIFVLIGQIACFKIICVNYDKLYCYRNDRERNCCIVEHFSFSSVEACEDAQNYEELHVVSKVPSLLKTF